MPLLNGGRTEIDMKVQVPPNDKGEVINLCLEEQNQQQIQAQVQQIQAQIQQIQGQVQQMQAKTQHMTQVIAEAKRISCLARTKAGEAIRIAREASTQAWHNREEAYHK